MKNPIKKVIAVHDLSGFGRCSFSVIIPTLSALGVQVCPLPTAVLSTHTGGYDGFTFRDLTEDVVPYFDHLMSLGTEFDAFYSGFLGNAEQIEQVEYMIGKSKGMTVLVDPVMGEDGELYSTYNAEMMHGMKRLIKNADIITPNVTEAAFLTDEEPKKEYTKEDIEKTVRRLSRLTRGNVVVTGIEGDRSVNCAFTSDGGITVGFTSNKRVGRQYPGTGDIFASVLLGKHLNGSGFEESIKASSSFVRSVMEYSVQFDYPEREGVLLEAKLSELF